MKMFDDPVVRDRTANARHDFAAAIFLQKSAHSNRGMAEGDAENAYHQADAFFKEKLRQEAIEADPAAERERLEGLYPHTVAVRVKAEEADPRLRAEREAREAKGVANRERAEAADDLDKE